MEISSITVHHNVIWFETIQTLVWTCAAYRLLLKFSHPNGVKHLRNKWMHMTWIFSYVHGTLTLYTFSLPTRRSSGIYHDSDEIEMKNGLTYNNCWINFIVAPDKFHNLIRINWAILFLNFLFLFCFFNNK